MKKRRRTTKKPYSRSIVGATLEVIQKKRTEKPEVRDAAREAALRYCSCSSCSFPLFLDVNCVARIGLTILSLVLAEAQLNSKDP